MPDVDAIAIKCPNCHKRFRVKKSVIEQSSKRAVKCPSCGGAIPLEREPAQPASQESPRKKSQTQVGLPGRGGATTDEDLRKLLLQAKRKRSTDAPRREAIRAPLGPADDTQPESQVPEDTQPDANDMTLPVGRSARTARELGTAGGPPPTPLPSRPRLDTPRAGARMQTFGTRHEPDEPTYTGPAPGRTPKVTPSKEDLGRFLVPGNYYVRVEDVIYAPVPHTTVAELVDAGVMLGVDEIAAEDGEWTTIVAGGPLGGLRGRLSHRAHHMLARAASARPASEYGRPPADEGRSEPLSGVSQTTGGAPSDADDTLAAPTADDTPGVLPAPAKKKSRAPLFVVAAFFLAMTGIAAALLLVPGVTDQLTAQIMREEPPEEPVDETPTLPATGVAVAEEPPPPDPTPAYQSAHAAIDSAVAVADSIDGLLNGAREHGPEELATTLMWMKWLRSPEDLDSHDLMQRMMKRGDYRQARQVANWLVATEGESDKLEKLVKESLEKQFAEETDVEISAGEFARILRVEPGHRPALVLEKKNGERWIFWPDLGKEGWRGDIAVYRLCQLMVCHFSIPETRSAVVDKKAWKALVRASEESVAEIAKKMRSDFDWSQKGVLRGSLRFDPGGARWPVEATSIWRPWLTAGTGTSKLDQSSEEAHHAVAFFGAEKVIPELDGVGARQLARQVSDLLLVDYLVSNWNRFAPVEEEWGTRTHITDGLVVSVDDSAAFLGEDSVRVRGRFSWASRFSRTTIESLRKLDSDEVGPLLFPEASKAEKEKLELLWSQRRKALRRIDKLVKKYGADDVFSLDAPAKPAKP